MGQFRATQTRLTLRLSHSRLRHDCEDFVSAGEPHRKMLQTSRGGMITQSNIGDAPEPSQDEVAAAVGPDCGAHFTKARRQQMTNLPAVLREEEGSRWVQ